MNASTNISKKQNVNINTIIGVQNNDASNHNYDKSNKFIGDSKNSQNSNNYFV